MADSRRQSQHQQRNSWSLQTQSEQGMVSVYFCWRQKKDEVFQDQRRGSRTKKSVGIVACLAIIVHNTIITNPLRELQFFCFQSVPQYTRIMNACYKCSSCGSDPCSCGGCKPAKYGCDFNIMANPYDPSIWNVTINGATTRVKIPKLNETDTKL